MEAQGLWNAGDGFEWAASSDGIFAGVDFVDSFARKEAGHRPPWYTGRESVIVAVEDFKRFMWLLMTHRQSFLVPTHLQDDVWHEFMLHPVKYFQFCMQACGELIDHNGGFGANPVERVELDRQFETTRKLWRQVFAQPHPVDFGCTNDDESLCSGPAPNCGRSCQHIPSSI